MKNLNRYERYKESKIDWIGAIPKEWDLVRYKRLFSITNGNGFPERLQGNKEGSLPFYKVSDINFHGKFIKESNNYVTDIDVKENKWNVVQEQSILTAKIGEALRKNHRKINEEPCLIDNNMMALSLKKGEIGYYYYFLSIVDMDWYANPGTVPSVNIGKFKEDFALSPSLEEQQIIASFLDEKTSEIDSLIADKEKLIELLEEKRQVIITEAVTKGLNPNVKMKDSGVEWIREIPEHWDIQPLFTLFKESKKKNVGNKEQNVLSLSYGKIIRRDVETNFGLLPESFETYQIVEKGYIVLRLTDLQNDKRSLRCGLVKEKGIITSAYVSLVPNDTINEVYAYYLLHAYDLFKVFYGLGSGVRQSMGFSDLKRVPILLPPKDEQNHIAEYLDEKNKEIDSLIIDLKKQITNLKEYRQSLIYEAVTGKIDVRDYVKA